MKTRLASFWFAYMAGFGVFFPLYSLYLQDGLGLAESRVGLVMSVIPLVGLVTQPLWGQAADRTGSRRLVLVLLAVGMAVASLSVLRVDGFVGVLLATAFVAVFSTAILPMATAVTLATLARAGGAAAFGQVRMWGTIGFLTAVLVFPRLLPLLDGLGADRSGELSLPGIGLLPAGLRWMFPVIAAFSLLAALLAARLPTTPELGLRALRGDSLRLLRHAPVARLLAFTFAAHLCLQGPINLFPLLVTARGGDVSSISGMWVAMLALEIPLVGFAGFTLRRFGARGLLRIGLAAEGLRWMVSAFTHDLALMGAMQLLHGVGVAGVIIGGPLYLEESVPERLRSTGQALISSVGFGLAAILSIAAGGWLIERFGPTLPYAAAGTGAFVLALLVRRLLPEPARPDESTLREILPAQR
ncbi:MAG: MFS transporter [Acidobacteriota bacterium]